MAPTPDGSRSHTHSNHVLSARELKKKQIFDLKIISTKLWFNFNFSLISFGRHGEITRSLTKVNLCAPTGVSFINLC